MVIMDILQPYKKLCTRYYDITKPRACTSEVEFYKKLLVKQGGVALEAMCGSGRLLIPLWQEGCVIEGVDNSLSMLAGLSEKLAGKALPYPVHQHDISKLSLDTTYSTIIIPVGSFQLLGDEQVAMDTLTRLYQHLQPNGVLALDLFVPWEGLVTGNEREESNSQVSLSPTESVKFQMHTRVDRMEQLMFTYATYTLFVAGIEQEKEYEEYILRWYYPREIQQILYTIGFQEITVQPITFKHNPDGFMVLATKR